MIVLVANDVCEGCGKTMHIGYGKLTYAAGMQVCGKCHEFISKLLKASQDLIDWEPAIRLVLRYELNFNYDQHSGKFHKKVKSVRPLRETDYESIFRGSTTLADMQIDLDNYIQSAEEEDISDARDATQNRIMDSFTVCGIEIDYYMYKKICDYLDANVVWEYDTEGLMQREFDL